MIEKLISISPFIVLFCSALLALGFSKNIHVNRNIAFAGFMLSILFNTLIIVYDQGEISFNNLQLSRGSYWLIEIFLLGCVIVFTTIEENLRNSHNEELISVSILLFSAGIVGILLTENLLVITIFYIFTVFSFGNVLFFGTYKKKLQSQTLFLTTNFISILILVLTDLIIYSTFRTLDISSITLEFKTAPESIQVISFLGLLFGFSIVAGIIPFTNWHLKTYFWESNPVNLRMFGNIFIPLCGVILLKVLAIIPLDLILYGHIIYFIAIAGLALSGIHTILELFGKLKEGTRSIPKIMGYYSVVEFNAYLFLISLLRLSFIPDSMTIINCFLQFLILSMFGKALIYEGLSPVFDLADDWNLDGLGGFKKYIPKHILFFLIVPIIFAFPGLIGFSFISNLLTAIIISQMEYPIQTAEVWSIGVCIIFLEIILFVIIATIINEIFLGKPSASQREIIPKIAISYYYSPILYIIIIIVFTVIFSNYFSFSTEIMKTIGGVFLK